MGIFNSLFGKIFELLFWPFRSLSPWFGMVIISILTALLMLFVFRLTSNQAGIRKTKNRIKAHLLELRLFKDNMGVTMKAQGNIFLANMRYIGHSARPMLVMIVPLILILIQLNLWFGYQALKVGETFILKAKVVEGQNLLNLNLDFAPSSAFAVDTPPLRIEEEGEIDWRLRPLENGIHALTMTLDGVKFEKQVAVGQKPLSKISPVKTNKNFLQQALNPGEPPLPSSLPLKSVEISYPARSMSFFGWSIHWLIVYFVLSIIIGFALKGVFKVEI